MDIIEAIGAIGGTLKLLLGFTSISERPSPDQNVSAREARSLSWDQKAIKVAENKPRLMPYVVAAIDANPEQQVGRIPKKLPPGKGPGVVDTPEELERLASMRHRNSRIPKES